MLYSALLRIVLFNSFHVNKNNMENLENQHSKQTTLEDIYDNAKLMQNIFKENWILDKIYNFSDSLKHEEGFSKNTTSLIP